MLSRRRSMLQRLVAVVAAGLMVGGCTVAGPQTATGASPSRSISTTPGSISTTPGADTTTPAAPDTSRTASSPSTGASTPSPSTGAPTPPSSAGATTPPGPITSVAVSATVATGLSTPWGVGFLPDGTALVTERDTGELLAISPGDLPAVRAVGVVDGVVPNGEGGLLGLAVSSRFAADRTVYAYYTATDDNRIAALTLDAGATTITDQRVILSGIPAAAIHNGGRLLTAPDGSLFVGTGDAAEKSRAQDLDYLGGKILHILSDGSAAPGNPFPEAPLVYSYGHRNVQGLAFDSEGRLWASEFGQNTYDELNLIQPGGNYGWPDAEGPSDDPRFMPPYRYWPTSDASPSGLAIVGDTALMATLRGQRLWLIPLGGGAGVAEPVAWLTGAYGRLRTVLPAPDGSIWLTTSNTDGRGDVRPGDDRVLRLVTG